MGKRDLPKLISEGDRKSRFAASEGYNNGVKGFIARARKRLPRRSRKESQNAQTLRDPTYRRPRKGGEPITWESCAKKKGGTTLNLGQDSIREEGVC